jgi:hypothetical protein
LSLGHFGYAVQVFNVIQDNARVFYVMTDRCLVYPCLPATLFSPESRRRDLSRMGDTKSLVDYIFSGRALYVPDRTHS